MKIHYYGGLYSGSVRKTKSRNSREKGKGMVKHRFIPHGWGFYEFKGDVKYTGWFRDGFEHGWGCLTWSNGDSYTCYFRKGRPEASVLKLVSGKRTATLIEYQNKQDI